MACLRHDSFGFELGHLAVLPKIGSFRCVRFEFAGGGRGGGNHLEYSYWLDGCLQALTPRLIRERDMESSWIS